MNRRRVAISICLSAGITCIGLPFAHAEGDGAQGKALAGTSTPPKMLPCGAPEYPSKALEQCKAGVSEVSVLLSSAGIVVKRQIDQSSGTPALDDAALEHFASCKFVPATNNGVGQQVWLKLKYRWVLPEKQICPKWSQHPDAVRVEPLEVLRPVGAGWSVTDQSQYGVTFVNSFFPATAFVKLFPLVKPYTPEEFLAEVRRNLDAQAQVGTGVRVSRAELALTEERPYLCARATQSRVVAGSPSDVKMIEKILFCRSPERTDVGFIIAFSFREGVAREKAAEEFWSGVRYVGLSSHYLE